MEGTGPILTVPASFNSRRIKVGSMKGSLIYDKNISDEVLNNEQDVANKERKWISAGWEGGLVLLGF